MPIIRPAILALDLEGTLISTAYSQIPRPGLRHFLMRCKDWFPRIVIFTAVEEARFRPIAKQLVEDGYAPPWFADIEYIQWQGPVKDLGFIPAAQVGDVLLVDDFEPFIHARQTPQWVKIDSFDPPYSETDAELERVLKLLEHYLFLRN
jgi:hypothetical protein